MEKQLTKALQDLLDVIDQSDMFSRDMPDRKFAKMADKAETNARELLRGKQS